MTKPITIKEIVREADDTLTYKFDIPNGTTWDSGANGHFLVADVQGNLQLNRTYVRHLSIMSKPKEGFLAFTTRITDNPSLFKQSLEKYQVGDEMRFFKIKNHIPLERDDSHIVLISMGVGIATFRPMILDYNYSQDGIISMININIDGSGQFIYQNELRGINAPKFQNKYVSNRNDLYQSIKESFNQPNTSYYVVGSDEFLKDMGKYLKENNIGENKVHFDKNDFQKKEFFTNWDSSNPKN